MKLPAGLAECENAWKLSGVMCVAGLATAQLPGMYCDSRCKGLPAAAATGHYTFLQAVYKMLQLPAGVQAQQDTKNVSSICSSRVPTQSDWPVHQLCTNSKPRQVQHYARPSVRSPVVSNYTSPAVLSLTITSVIPTNAVQVIDQLGRIATQAAELARTSAQAELPAQQQPSAASAPHPQGPQAPQAASQAGQKPEAAGLEAGEAAAAPTPPEGSPPPPPPPGHPQDLHQVLRDAC